MPDSNEAIDAIREAVELSPQNLALRLHLANLYLNSGKAIEAEKQFRAALTMAPQDAAIKLGLARSYFAQGKTSPAVVIVEELLQNKDVSSGVFLLHARLLLEEGDIRRAVRQYKRAADAEPPSTDETLAEKLGIPLSADDEPDDDDDELFEGRLRIARDGEPSRSPVPTEIERPKISFADVGGMESLKDEVRAKIIHPLSHPELYQAYGKAVGGGILMYGPPGCGKTYLARATAGEIKSNFISVGISQVLDMWIGSSERNLHEMFEQARQNKPCVLFFDEVDALAASRSDMRTSAGRQIINQFLAELDGIQSSNDGVLILAATNAPWHLDSAFRRPGRFDRIIFVPPPDRAARAEILQILCRNKPQGDIDFNHLAGKVENFSGADLKAIVDLAVEAKLQDAVKLGGVQPLTTKDLLAAAARVKPSTREWFSTAKNYALYSNQGGTYDDILKYLKI